MSAAFTPGPWKSGHLGMDALWIGPDYDQTPVATVDHDTENARGNSRTNAHLIAAAPELYVALAAAVASADPVQCSSWVARARQALAKARGDA